MNENFTAAYDSASMQSPYRVITFEKWGERILGIGAHSSSLELVIDTSEGPFPYTLDISDQDITSGDKQIRPSGECTSCHGSPFTYIWKEYSNSRTNDTWSGFLGDSDDRVNPESSDFKLLSTIDNFKPLFDSKEKGFPYWHDEDSRRLETMPNTRLTVIVAARSAKNVIVNLSKQSERFEKYKYTLLKNLIDCSSSSAAIDSDVAARKSGG